MSDGNKAKKWPQYLAATCVCIGALGAGTVLGWSANITDDLKEGELNDLVMNDDELGWAGSAMTLGALVMCIPIGWIADLIGRKPTVLLTTFPFVIGWLLITFAQHMVMVYVGRILVGIAGGSFCVTAPLYTSEISETDIRGRLGTFLVLFMSIGIFYAQLCGYALPMMGYHFMLLAVPIVFTIAFIFMPETPMHLMRKGKLNKVLGAYRFLRGKEYDPSEEIKAIEEQIAKEAQGSGFCETMKSKASKKATLICFVLMFYQQLSGINAVVFYTKEIFIESGSELPPHWCVVIIGVIQIFASFIPIWLMDKLGRKILLMTSCALMGVSSFSLGLFFTLKDDNIVDKHGVKDIGFIPIVSLIIYIVFFCVGMGPIPWMAPSEIFAPEVKAKCGSAAATFNWFLGFLVTRFFLNVTSAIGNDMTFYIFGISTSSAVFFVLFCMPETKGKGFAEIQSELAGTSP